MTASSLKRSLIENSHTFMTEAARKAIAAREDIGQWPFAILNLVQAVELSLKELLRRQHPILIFSDVDSPRNTVSLTKALERIQNPKILGITIPRDEMQKIEKASELRNKITHFEFELTAEHAMAKFSELFAFLVYFQGRFLAVEIDHVLPAALLKSVMEIDKCFSELRRKALQRIEDEHIYSELVWCCPECGEETFVIEDSRNVCWLCRATASVVGCPQCGKPCFEGDMESFWDLIDSEYDEGETHIRKSYGYSTFTACLDCISAIRTDIEEKKRDDYYNHMAEAEWLWTQQT